MERINIYYSVEELKRNIDDKKYYCLYLAHKDKKRWERSTSRIYMNNLIEDFIYQPIDIEKEDHNSLKEIYELVEERNNIIAINQTQPHKSNPVLKEYFKNITLPNNVDSLIKDNQNKLIPYDLNGPSFISWYKDDIGSFKDKIVFLLGVGGVGEPLARAIIKESPKKLFLIDPVNKNNLKEELSDQGNVEYSEAINNIDTKDISDLIFINAAGKEGVENQETINIFLEEFKNMNYIFVDLRPHIEIPIVKKANELGWKGYTGHGMNAYNDYVLLQKIAKIIKVPILTFSDFKEKVYQAS
jgi:shikimate 5-dehydrogenase